MSYYETIMVSLLLCYLNFIFWKGFIMFRLCLVFLVLLATRSVLAIDGPIPEPSFDVGSIHIGPENSGVSPDTVLGDYEQDGVTNGRNNYFNGEYFLWWQPAADLDIWLLTDTPGVDGNAAVWVQINVDENQAVDASPYYPSTNATGPPLWATINPIPEPSTLTLTVLGLLSLAFYGRRRRKTGLLEQIPQTVRIN